MKVRKTIKKIAALGVGASMLGATVLGATAADLSNFPSNYMDDGKFQGSLVVGDNAISSDTIGAIDIATGLASSSGESGDDASVSEGAQISSTGNDLNIGENFTHVLSSASMDDSNLPNLLAEETYQDTEGENDNEEDYSQEVTFSDGQGELMLYQDADDGADEGGLYVHLSDSDDVYNYSLEFDTSIEFDAADAGDDLESTNLEIQGNTYTITDVDTSGLKLDELTLQAGDTTQWIEQGQPVTKNIDGEEREVELSNVDEGASQCGIMVDGTLKWVDDGSTDTINGVEVGVTDAISVHSEAKDNDVCKVNLGSSEIVLEDGNNVEVNSQEIDGTDVSIDNDGNQSWDGFTISQEPDEDIYLSEGDAYVDPVFDNFEIKHAGLYKPDSTDVSLDSSGETMTLSFDNIDGESIEIPFTVGNEGTDNSAYSIGSEYSKPTGEDADSLYYLKDRVCEPAGGATDCEGARTLVTAGDELHVVEISDVDLDDDEVTVKDVTYGGTDTEDIADDGSVSADPGAPLNFDVTDDKIDFSGSGDSIVASGDSFDADNELMISIDTADYSNASKLNISFDESEGDVDTTDDEPGPGVLDADFSYDGGDDEEWDIDRINGAGSSVDSSEDNDDDQVYYSDYGTKVVHDDDDNNALDLSYSEEELRADVYIAPVGAVVSGGSDDSSSDASMDVGSAQLASEVSLDGQNNILVGGPCANQKSAEFAGVSMDNCAEGAPEENTAVIKLKEYGDKVSMLINGYSAMDSRRASRVVANYGDYDLSGSEMVVSGTGFTDIDVSAPSPEAEEEEEAEDSADNETTE